MALTSYVQTNFLGGEISQAAQGRMDSPAYKISMNICLNGIPIESGAWVRRPGTRHVAPTRGGKQGKLIPFAFEESHPYVMEFTDAYLRFTTGAALVMTNDAQAVTAISAANPAEVTTTTAHTWVTGNCVAFDTFGVNNPLLHNRQFTMTKTGATKFTLADSVTGAAIDGATLGAFVSGNVTRVLEIATTYIGSSWQTARSIQAEKRSVLVNGAVAPQVLQVTADPTDTAFAQFSLSSASFVDGPYLDPVAGGAILTPSAQTGIVTLTVSFPPYSATKAYTIGDFVASVGVNYQSLIDQNVNNTPAGSPTAWQVVAASIAVGPSGFLSTDIGRAMRLQDRDGNWTWGRITALLNKIPGNLAGSINIGDMTGGGGLPAAFDGVLSKVLTACAFQESITPDVVGGQGAFVFGYVGKNYSASPKAIKSATLRPASDGGLGYVQLDNPTTTIQFTALVYLRAKQTPPASRTDGASLGSFIQSTPFDSSGSYNRVCDTGPITIVSSDQTTAWNYVWFDVEVICSNKDDPFSGQTRDMLLFTACGQAEFFTPTITSGDGVSFEILGDNLGSLTTISVWRMGVYSDTTGWPTCGAYHEGRLWLGGVVPNRFDASVSNGITGSVLNFTPTGTTGVVSDNNAISYTFLGKDVNALLWMEPDQQGIICGTKAGEMLISAPSPGPLSPTNIKAVRVTKIGCANIEPRRAEHTLVFVQKFQRKIMEYFADVYSGKFSAPNLSERAKHLTVGNIEEIAYQQELAPILWARRGDGALVGATYKRDTLTTSQGPNVIGWHRHTLGSGRTVDSICVGPSADGTLETLSLITSDPVTGVRHLELMTDLLDEGFALTDCWFLDDAIVPSATLVQLAPTGGSFGSLVVYGLSAHEGKEITAFIAGLDCGEFTVTGGAITVPFGDGVSGGTGAGLLTATLVNSFDTLPAVIGFNYTSDGQLVRPVTAADTGAQAGPGWAKLGRAHRAAAQLYGAVNTSISFGTDFVTMYPAKLLYANNVPYTVQQQWSGIWRDNTNSVLDFDGMVAWRITRPWPVFVTAAGSFSSKADA